MLCALLPSPAVAQEPQAARGAAAPPTFRTEAWDLPDEPLLGFVEIPAGSVLVGSDPTRDPMAFDNERWDARRPQGTVEVERFYIGRYEVTVGQFGAFVESTGYTVGDTIRQGPPSHPVVGVSWTDALAYCRWLETVLKESPIAPPALHQLLSEGWRVTLPTEAEWERAARGADGRIYPWGDQPSGDRANFGAQATTAVGSLECADCLFGLSDMSGNIWEWTRSPYQPYPYEVADDRDDLDVDALWVIRGGSFADPPELVRAATRGAAAPGVRRPYIGFRVVITRF